MLTSKAEMKPRSYQRACLGYPQLISVCKIFLPSNRPQNRSAENMLMSHFKYTFKSVHHYHPLDALTSFRMTNDCLKLNIKMRAREKWGRMGPNIVFFFLVLFFVFFFNFSFFFCYFLLTPVAWLTFNSLLFCPQSALSENLQIAVEKVDRFWQVIYIIVMNKTSKFFGPTAKWTFWREHVNYAGGESWNPDSVLRLIVLQDKCSTQNFEYLRYMIRRLFYSFWIALYRKHRIFLFADWLSRNTFRKQVLHRCLLCNS